MWRKFIRIYPDARKEISQAQRTDENREIVKRQRDYYCERRGLSFLISHTVTENFD